MTKRPQGIRNKRNNKSLMHHCVNIYEHELIKQKHKLKIKKILTKQCACVYIKFYLLIRFILRTSIFLAYDSN